MLKKLTLLTLICSANIVFAASAKELFVPVYFTTSDNQTHAAGTIHVTETDYGLLFTPDLHGLTPGEHDFNVHENPSCANHGLAAGGDLDPHHTNKHLGPYNSQGHLGDLPMLYVSAEGTAFMPVLAPRLLSLDEIKNHALVIEAHNKRIACGVVEKTLFSS